MVGGQDEGGDLNLDITSSMTKDQKWIVTPKQVVGVLTVTGVAMATVALIVGGGDDKKSHDLGA